jgi:hypothetical protein
MLALTLPSVAGQLHAALSAGTECVLQSGRTPYLGVAAFSDGAGLACYRDTTNAEMTTCSVLPTGWSAPGAKLVVANATSDHLAVATLGASAALVCLPDSSRGNVGVCLALARSGSSLALTDALTVVSSTAVTLALAALSSSAALVCSRGLTPPGTPAASVCTPLTAA